MRQRLGIAAALLRDPRLLLLDEPTTGLDPGGMRDMRRLVRRLAGQGITVLLSSHLMGEVEELCDRVAIVRTGPGRLRGLARRAARVDRRPLPAAHHRRHARRRGSPRDRHGIADVRFADGGLTLSAGEEAVAALSIALGEAGIGIAALVPRTRHARGAVLPDDRGRRRAGARGRPRGGAAMSAAPSRRRRWRRAPAWARSTAGSCASCIAQKRTYLGLGAALVPVIFVVALLADPGGGGPRRSPFGAFVRETGLAIPLVCLLFGSIWLIPLITSLVAGDIVATEDQNGTLKTILTRSVERWQIFAARCSPRFTYARSRWRCTSAPGCVLGGLAFGFDPVTLLSGTR